jgi:hypothetical protein
MLLCPDCCGKSHSRAEPNRVPALIMYDHRGNPGNLPDSGQSSDPAAEASGILRLCLYRSPKAVVKMPDSLESDAAAQPGNRVLFKRVLLPDTYPKNTFPYQIQMPQTYVSGSTTRWLEAIYCIKTGEINH